jgi:hypothetical protein
MPARCLVFPLLGVLGVLATCSSPPPLAPDRMEDPSLRRIHARFAETVRTARADPDGTWRSGWFGNVAVAFGGENERGLCYEWQGLVHAGVRDIVVGEGWDLLGVSINRHTANEHHAVIVWNPAAGLTRANVLEAALDRPAWVLDAWQRGEPDMWHVRDWVRLPLLVRVAPVLEDPYPGGG